MRSLVLLIFSTALLAAVGTAGVIQPELEAQLIASATIRSTSSSFVP